MKKALILLSVTSLALSACLTARPDGTAENPARDSAITGPAKVADERASVNGKYRDLIQKVHCPDDVNQYGEFHDYGHWTGSEHCGQQVSSGFWVYVSPDWYVWRTQNDLPRPEPNLATVNGKYSGLLQSLLCPGDRAQYGDFRDYGYWADGETYCGQRVQGGYWVYRYPYWYIWQTSSTEEQWR
ncbi:MAG TPA: hypothetical protein PKY31_04685 [Spirochaetota bacterium]|nr:hypothetical protein [Spirochaetota bacterium]